MRYREDMYQRCRLLIKSALMPCHVNDPRYLHRKLPMPTDNLLSIRTIHNPDVPCQEVSMAMALK